ncbi:uncharacterized protein LOC114531870 [Dendronephthya gigantea]|uniref:uncharacterized protein LOC114531870 n=1 Tax=Dendronephthya gigantea TaxID=151771 RepID=UPI00106DC67D|nr:uncharacterized protein LOC114531870 [Dendronephthya gigantea]
MEYERSSDGGNGNGQGRLIIDEEKLAILKSFFISRNMDSTKKQNLAVIKECANQTMLTEQQVKHWISNYRAKTSGRISGKVGKSRLMRKRSGFNVFASENLFKESSGSSSNAFKNIGDKWRSLSDEQKDTFRRKALESDKDVCLPSNNAKAKKIINNMMKEVQELEALGGHCLLICGFEGHVFHGSTDVGNKMLNDSENDLVHHFANLLQCSQDGKENISVKAIQELFNKKYGEVVKKKNGKMPYSKIQEYGIAFIGLPAHLEIDIGTTPRKPALYGSAQRRELWQSRNAWSLTITSSSNLISNAHTDAGHSALQSISDPVVSNYMLFGLMAKNSNDVQAIAVVSGQTRVHGETWELEMLLSKFAALFNLGCFLFVLVHLIRTNVSS